MTMDSAGSGALAVTLQAHEAVQVHICNSALTPDTPSVYKNTPLGHRGLIIGILPASPSPQTHLPTDF